MLYKKSMTQNALVSIGIVLFVALISIIVVVKYREDFLDKGDVQSCRSSILLSASSKKMASLTDIGSGESHFSINCPRQELVIKKKDVVKNGVFDQKTLHKILADAMAECWYMVGEGKLDPFSDWDNKGKTYCLVCKTVVFDDKLNEFIGSHADDFDISKFELTMSHDEAEQKVRENALKFSPTDPAFYIRTQYVANSNKTYFEYFYGEKPDLSHSELQLLQEQSVRPFFEGTTMIIRMSKLETKSTLAKIGVYVGVGLAITAGVALMFVPVVGWGVAGAGLVALMSTTATISAAGIASLILVAAAIGGPILGITSGNVAYAECPECQAAGGIAYVPPMVDYSQKIMANIEKEDGSTEEIEMPLCNIVVN